MATETLTCTIDNYIDEGFPTSNYGTNVSLWLKDKTGERRRSLLRFTGMSAYSTITSAKLRLKVYDAYSGGAFAARVMRCTRNFNETGSTWEKFNATTNWTAAGGDADTGTYNDIIFAASYSSLATIEIDVTDVIRDAYFEHAQTANLNLIIKAVTESSGVNHTLRMLSGETTQATNRPQLIVDYSAAVNETVDSPAGDSTNAGVAPAIGVEVSTRVEATSAGISTAGVNPLVVIASTSVDESVTAPTAGTLFGGEIPSVKVSVKVASGAAVENNSKAIPVVLVISNPIIQSSIASLASWAAIPAVLSGRAIKVSAPVAESFIAGSIPELEITKSYIVGAQAAQTNLIGMNTKIKVDATIRTGESKSTTTGNSPLLQLSILTVVSFGHSELVGNNPQLSNGIVIRVDSAASDWAATGPAQRVSYKYLVQPAASNTTGQSVSAKIGIMLAISSAIVGMVGLKPSVNMSQYKAVRGVVLEAVKREAMLHACYRAVTLKPQIRGTQIEVENREIILEVEN